MKNNFLIVLISGFVGLRSHLLFPITIPAMKPLLKSSGQEAVNFPVTGLEVFYW